MPRQKQHQCQATHLLFSVALCEIQILPGVGRFVPPESREGRASNLRVTAPPYRRISQPREVPLNQLLEDVLDPQKRGPALIHLATVLSPVISLLPIPLFLLFFLIRKCRVTERSGSKIYMIFMYESRNYIRCVSVLVCACAFLLY